MRRERILRDSTPRKRNHSSEDSRFIVRREGQVRSRCLRKGNRLKDWPRGRHQGRTESGLTRCSSAPARESIIQTIRSSVPKVTAVQTKLNFLPSRIRMCARHNCTSPLKKDYRGFKLGRNRHCSRCTAKARGTDWPPPPPARAGSGETLLNMAARARRDPEEGLTKNTG